MTELIIAFYVDFLLSSLRNVCVLLSNLVYCGMLRNLVNVKMNICKQKSMMLPISLISSFCYTLQNVRISHILSSFVKTEIY